MPVTKENDVKKDLILKSFLQSGNDLKLSETLTFKHPTIQEIIDIDKEHFGLYSEDIYYSFVDIFLTDPYNYMVYLDDRGIDYEQVTGFDVFCMLFDEYNKNYSNLLMELENKNLSNDYKLLFENHIYFQSFKFFFGIESFFLASDSETGKNILAYENNKFLMNEYIFNFVSEFVRKINGIPDVEKINPEDEWSKKILIEDERERIKKKLKNKDETKNMNRLGNLISAITWASNGCINPFNRNNLHIYDLVDGISRTDKLLNYQNTMNGLYSGCIEGKKINFNSIHWSSD